MVFWLVNDMDEWRSSALFPNGVLAMTDRAVLLEDFRPFNCKAGQGRDGNLDPFANMLQRWGLRDVRQSGAA